MTIFPIIRKYYWGFIRFIGMYYWYVIADCLVKVAFYYLIQRKKSAGYPVVVIDHNFIQDIEALRDVSSTEQTNIIRIPYESFYLLAGCYFCEDSRDGSYLAEEIQLPREQYNKMLRRLFLVWRPKKFITVFVCPSDSFFWIREIIALLHENMIPCVVVDKEGTISPHSMEHHSRQIVERYPFISDRILVWSERQSEFWQRTGVAAEQIRIVGQPRSDFFFNTSAWLPRFSLPGGNKPLILFFTFETDAYAPTPGYHIWRDLRDDIDESIVTLAKRFPEKVFVVKTHPQQQDRLSVERKFTVAGLQNIVVCHGAELSRHLIVHAAVVIGFQTTALIEAMLAGKRVVYAEWSRAVFANRHHLIPFHEAKGIDIVDSQQEFDGLLEEMLSCGDFLPSNDSLAARKPFVDIYIPNADGNASRRVLQQLHNLLDERSGVA